MWHSVRPVLGVAAYFITEPRFTSCRLRCLPLQEGGGERFFSGFDSVEKPRMCVGCVCAGVTLRVWHRFRRTRRGVCRHGEPEGGGSCASSGVGPVWGNVQEKKPWDHAFKENTFEFRNQSITMASPSSTHPSKPADQPGGTWVLTRYNPGGCARVDGPGPHLAVCRTPEPIYRWVFVKDGQALDVRGPPLSFLGARF